MKGKRGRLSDQDEEGKTKQKCIISDPSFSMVTVQREDSGITWETNSNQKKTYIDSPLRAASAAKHTPSSYTMDEVKKEAVFSADHSISLEAEKDSLETVLEEPEKEDTETSLPMAATPEPEDSNLVEEEIIELDYPESPSASEEPFLPRLAPEVEQEEETILPLLTTSNPEHVALSEEEREENESATKESLKKTDHKTPVKSEIVSEPMILPEEEKEDTGPYSPGVSEHKILSEEEKEDTGLYFPEVAPVSEHSLPPYPAEEEEIETEKREFE
ncbi:hypothetical protein CB1_000917031, partial [Camelus ferus]